MNIVIESCNIPLNLIQAWYYYISNILASEFQTTKVKYVR